MRAAVFVASALPAVWLGVMAFSGELGANPIATAMNQLGLMALTFLIGSLACTPLKEVFGWVWPIRIRRMLGLYAFFYASLHFLTYLGLDQLFDFKAVFADITKRQFIYIGFAAYVMLVPLAVTSTDRMVRRLGFARWKWLHRLAYLAAILGVIHFVMRVKKDLSQPLTYGFVLGALLMARVILYFLKKLKQRGSRRIPAPARPV